VTSESLISMTPSIGALAQKRASEENDSKIKEALLRLADDYNDLAHWAESWALRRLLKN
jgi:hypothetical protein